MYDVFWKTEYNSLSSMNFSVNVWEEYVPGFQISIIKKETSYF